MTTSLQDFVNQQKAKQSSFGSASSLLSPSISSFGDLRAKITSSINSLPGLGSQGTVETQSLTSESSSGQLPPGRNRKNGGIFASLIGDEGTCGMSRTQRILTFFLFLVAAMFCFGMAIMLLPVIILKARKFAALNTLGSVMLIMSFAFLLGPLNYLKHMLSEQRRLVTVSYLITVIATLYSSLWLRSTLVTIFFSFIEAIALVYVLSYAPGGERGLRFIAGLFGSFVKTRTKTVLPI
uniref:Vesicle transport protein n=1 Tax=Syphacia muris TaxID=451379 RepID=A0A0N5A7U8_9BILA